MTIKPAIALIKKELIEHKGAFFIAPAILNIIFFILMLLSTLFNVNQWDMVENTTVVAYISAFGFYSIYLVISLFFYYADAFCSDNRDNSMLFWKSLPISDLKILSIKFFTGIIIVPLIIIGWVVCWAILSYFLGLFNFSMLENFLMPWTAIAVLAKFAFYSAIFLIIWSLWLAPFYAWVAVLSVFFRKWSIALAFIIPLVLITIEQIFNFDFFNNKGVLGEFLYGRLFFITVGDIGEVSTLILGTKEIPSVSDFNEILWIFVSQVRWLSLVIGLFVAAAFIYIASEYRKRFIQG